MLIFCLADAMAFFYGGEKDFTSYLQSFASYRTLLSAVNQTGFRTPKSDRTPEAPHGSMRLFVDLAKI